MAKEIEGSLLSQSSDLTSSLPTQSPSRINHFYVVAALSLASGWLWLVWPTLTSSETDPNRWREPWANLMANALVGTLAVLVTNLVLGKRLLRQQQVQIANVLAQIRLFSNQFFQSLPTPERQTIISDFFREACPGAEEEEIRQYVQILHDPAGRRRDFHYKARLGDLPKSLLIKWGTVRQPAPPVLLDKARYWMVASSISFEASVNKAWMVPGNRVYVAVCLDEMQLRTAFEDDLCIYREHLSLNSTDRPAFQEAVRFLASLPLPGGGALESLQQGPEHNELFDSRLFVDGVAISSPGVKYDDRVGLRYDFWAGANLFHGKEWVKLALTLYLPFGQEQNFFPILFRVPTKVSSVYLDAALATDHLQVFDAVSVMDRKKIAFQPAKGTCNILFGDQWVMPWSGLSFWWNM